MTLKITIVAALLAATNASILPAGQPLIQTAPLAVTKTVATEPYDPNPQYNYGYEVQDPLTGDSHGQVESRSGDVVKGSYALLDSDGTRRVVDYTADPINGFNAVVSKQPVGKIVAPVAVTAQTISVARPALTAAVAEPLTAIPAAPVAVNRQPIAELPVAPVALAPQPLAAIPAARIVPQPAAAPVPVAVAPQPLATLRAAPIAVASRPPAVRTVAASVSVDPWASVPFVKSPPVVSADPWAVPVASAAPWDAPVAPVEPWASPAASAVPAW